MPGPPSDLERDMAFRLARLSVPPWQRDYVFHPSRKWELDFAWPDLLIYVSVEGGISKSSHRTVANIYKKMVINGRVVRVKVGEKDGYSDDLEKHTEAAILGWLGVRVSRRMIESGLATELVRRAFQIRNTKPF
jgi:hypothetical protein